MLSAADNSPQQIITSGIMHMASVMFSQSLPFHRERGVSWHMQYFVIELLIWLMSEGSMSTFWLRNPPPLLGMRNFWLNSVRYATDIRIANTIIFSYDDFNIFFPSLNIAL